MASNSGSDYVEADSSFVSLTSNPEPKKVHKYPGFWKTDPVDAPVFGSSRHDFQGPLKFQQPNPNDLVYWSARAIVEAYQQDQPFKKFANELFMSALNCAPTLFFNYFETEPVVHAIFREGLVAKVQLKLVCDIEFGWTSSTVLMRDGDRWIPFADFLKTLPDVECIGQVGYWVQHRWWKSMKKPFRLMDLPTEIRDLVLLFGLGEQIVPCSSKYWGSVLSLTQGDPKPNRYTPHHDRLVSRIPATNLSVLCINKDLSAITTRMLWRDTTKVFRNDWDLNVICRPMSPTNIFMRRIQLSLSTTSLVKLFDVKVFPFNRHVDTTSCIQSLSNLNFLEIEFSDRSYSNPWNEFMHEDPDATDEMEAAGLDRHIVPCQRVLVEMIMSFAAPQLQHIKTVKLTGMVKTCTKKKWEQLLNKTSFGECKDEIEGWKQGFTEMKPHELPPRCFCPKECTHQTGDFDHDDVSAMEDRLLPAEVPDVESQIDSE